MIRGSTSGSRMMTSGTFKHSEAVRNLFHVYATAVVKIKDLIKNLSTNGGKDREDVFKSLQAELLNLSEVA